MDNRREFFRIAVLEIEMVACIDGETHRGKLRDLSGSGVSFYLGREIEFDKAMITFRLENDSFEEEISLIRKEYTQFGDYLYACHFVELEEKIQSRMLSTLLRWDALRRNK